MTQVQNNLQPLGFGGNRQGIAVGVLMVGIDAVLFLLALIAADSIYNLHPMLRMVLLGAGVIALAVATYRAIRRAGSPRSESGGPADRKRLAHRGIIGALLLLFMVGAVAVQPKFFEIGLGHILRPWADFRSRATPEPQLDEEQQIRDSADSDTQAPREMKVEPGDTEIQRGDSLRIVVAPSHPGVPVTLRYVGPDGRWLGKPMPEDPAQPEKYSDFLRDVGQDLSYQVFTGRMASPVYHVRVYDVAGLKAIRLSYKYPASAGLPDRIVTSTDGTIEAMPGTLVEVTLMATGSLRSSWLQLDGGPVMAMDVRGPEASREIEVTGDSNYALMALDAKGTPLDLPAHFGIRATQKSAPKLETGERGVQTLMQPME